MPSHTHPPPHIASMSDLDGGSFKTWLPTFKNRNTTFRVVLQPQQQQYQERNRTLANYINAHCKCQREPARVQTNLHTSSVHPAMATHTHTHTRIDT